jgi:hypothetical protein
VSNTEQIQISNGGNGIVHARLTQPAGPLPADSLLAAAFYYAGTGWFISDCLDNDSGPIKGKDAAVQALHTTAAAVLDAIAVETDDCLLNALGSATPDTASHLADDELCALTLAWRNEIEASDIPELIDVDTALATIKAGAA